MWFGVHDIIQKKWILQYKRKVLEVGVVRVEWWSLLYKEDTICNAVHYRTFKTLCIHHKAVKLIQNINGRLPADHLGWWKQHYARDVPTLWSESIHKQIISPRTKILQFITARNTDSMADITNDKVKFQIIMTRCLYSTMQPPFEGGHST